MTIANDARKAGSDLGWLFGLNLNSTVNQKNLVFCNQEIITGNPLKATLSISFCLVSEKALQNKRLARLLLGELFVFVIRWLITCYLSEGSIETYFRAKSGLFGKCFDFIMFVAGIVQQL